MHPKNVVVFTLLFCGVFQYAVATGILFNALKNTVQNTRCKLHNLGSKIIQHDHHNSDPCAQTEINHAGYGENDHGSVGHGNNNFGSSSYGNNNFGSSSHGNDNFGLSSHGNNNFGSSSNGNENFGSSNNGNDNFGSSSHGNDNFGSSSHGNNNFGYQNAYQVTENLDEDRSRTVENNQELFGTSSCTLNSNCPYNRACIRNNCVDPCPGTCNINANCNVINHIPNCKCKPGYVGDGYIGSPSVQCHEEHRHFYNGHSYGSSSEQNNNNFGLISTTGRYQPTVNTDANKIVKDTSSKGLDDKSYEITENEIKNIFERPNVLNNSSSSNDNKTMENLIQDIFGKPSSTTENYPVTLDIDVRGGPKKQLSTTTRKTYATVPREGGKHVGTVLCPAGTITTKDGECLHEFK